MQKKDENIMGFFSNSNLRGRFHFTQKLKIASLLYMLTQLPTAFGDSIYPKDLISGITYRLDFNPLDFPDVREVLPRFCNVLIDNFSLKNFTTTLSPQCLSEENILGPAIDVAVESGRSMTSGFQECLGNAMKQLCDEYYNRKTVDNSLIQLELIGATALAVILFIGVCSCLWAIFNYSGNKSKQKENSPLLPVKKHNNTNTYNSLTVNSTNTNNNSSTILNLFTPTHTNASVVWKKP